MAIFRFVLFIGIGMAFSAMPWYQAVKQPGANFYEIKKQRMAELASQEELSLQDLTKILLEDPALYELEYDFQFNRWAEYVEPRVAPSGDLSLLNIGLQEALKYVPLDGRSLPPMKGDWKPMGPFAENTAGAGRLNWVEFHPTNRNTFMVGSSTGGLWFTTDAGSTWKTTTDKLAVLGAGWAVYDPANPSIIYMGTGDGDYNQTPSIGLLKSTDGGITWNTTGLTFSISGRTQIHKVAYHASSKAIFVAASNGLHRSTNGGQSFSNPSGISGDIEDIEFHPTNNNIVYASSRSFYRSTDGGASFSQVSSLSSASHKMLIAVTRAAPDYVYTARVARGSTEGIYRSTNSGGSFSNTGNGSAIGCGQAWYDYGFGASHTDAGELTAGCLRIFQSTNGGSSWSQHGSSYHVDIHGTIYHNDGTLYTVNDGGIWRSTTGTSWQNLNNNLNISDGYRLGVFPTDYDRICTGRQDNGTDIHANTSRGFRRALGADGFECFWNLTGDTFYGESQNGGFQRCSYNSSTGTTSGCTSSIRPSAGGTWNTPWAQDPNNNTTIFAGRGSNMWRSTSRGDNWSQMGTVGGSGSIRNFVVAPSNSQVLYVMKGSNVHRTSNGGSSWSDVWSSGGTPMNATVNATDPNDVWVVLSGYSASSKVYHSSNGGSSWTNETRTGLPNVPANTVVLDPKKPGAVYVGTDAGVFYRDNNFSTWQNFSDNLPNSDVMELEIAQKGSNSNDRMLLATTYGRGIWRTRLWDDVTSIESKTILPELRKFTFQVQGNNLHLQFHLGTDRPDKNLSHIQLTDLQGKILFQETVEDFGLYRREIDMSKKGKGIYLFVVKKDGQRITRQVALY